MIEREVTYLAKNIPKGLTACPSKETIDIYFPATSDHPVLRLRKQGDTLELTKKEPVKEGDASTQTEQTIILTSVEYKALATLPGKRLHKLRYYYEHEGRTAEFDVFQEGLAGLVVVDFEFETEEEKIAFTMPDFCLADITQETFIAGGMVCGKSYSDLEPLLKKYDYQKLTV